MGDCEHDWQLDEVVVEQVGADLVTRCVHCGTTRYEPGQGRGTRPALPELPELRA